MFGAVHILRNHKGGGREGPLTLIMIDDIEGGGTLEGPYFDYVIYVQPQTAKKIELPKIGPFYSRLGSFSLMQVI